MKNKSNMRTMLYIWAEIKKEELLKLVIQEKADINIVTLNREPDCANMTIAHESDKIHVIEIKQPVSNAIDAILLEKSMYEIAEFLLSKRPDIMPVFLEPREHKYDRNAVNIHNYSTARAKANSAKYNNFKRTRNR